VENPHGAVFYANNVYYENQEYSTLTIFSYFRHNLFLILMKTKYCLLLTILLVIQSICSLQAQTTEGTDFWLTFGKNTNHTFNMVNLHLRIVGGEQAGNFYVTYNESAGYTVSYPIAANEIKTLILTPTQNFTVYNDYSTTTVTNRSIHITSTVPVIVYALNKAQSSTDASNILPVTALGTEYYHISYTPLAPYLDAYSVIATENNTIIYHNGGAPVATLNAGQVYYRTSSTDMTGAYITSNKPVAFFAQCQSAQIPA
jgi:hypothetical protein